jgi:hypothetical protein
VRSHVLQKPPRIDRLQSPAARPIRVVPVALAAVTLLFSPPAPARAQRIDTEHLFGFMIGTDVGELGDKEIEGETIARWGKRSGSYLAAAPAFEAEFVPIENLRASGTIAAARHEVSGVDGLENRRQWAFDSLAFDLRYRLIDRRQTGFGLAIDVEPHWGRVDATSGEPVDRYGADFSLLLDRELVPDRVLAAVNFTYQPEAARSRATGSWTREAVLGPAAGVMVQIQPGILIGAEARYLRAYQDLAVEKFAGRALFAGPTLFARLSQRVWVIAAWSPQIAGRAAHVPGSLDLTNFERHQAKVQFGIEY